MIHLVCKCEIIYEYVDVMGSLQGVVFPAREHICRHV